MIPEQENNIFDSKRSKVLGTRMSSAKVAITVGFLRHDVLYNVDPIQAFPNYGFSDFREKNSTFLSI